MVIELNHAANVSVCVNSCENPAQPAHPVLSVPSLFVNRFTVCRLLSMPSDCLCRQLDFCCSHIDHSFFDHL